MKTSATFKIVVTSIFLILFTLLPFSTLLSQACPTTTLSTQAQVNAFNCTSINGDLIIDDGGSGSINNLNPIWVGGLRGSGAIVTGNVVVRNCPNLTSLYGLDGIVRIDDRLSISNCSSLNSISIPSTPFEITAIGDFLILQDLPNLTTVSAFSKLQSITNGLDVIGDVKCNDWSGFNTLTYSPVVEFHTTNVGKVNGFTNLTTCAYFNLFQNTSLTSVTGFNSLANIQPVASWDRYQISGNTQLNTFTAHPNLMSVQSINVINNPQLSSCCFLLPLFDSNPSPITISGNAFGCNSVAQIDAPPMLGTCPANKTIATSSNSCLGTSNLISPTVTDNCDLSTFHLNFLGGQGTIVNNFGITSGQNVNYGFELGTNTVTFVATDANSNMSTCVTSVFVNDNTNPVISNIPADVTIGCNDPFPTVPNPLFTDNCDPSPSLAASSSILLGSCEFGEAAEIQEYSWSATDASGNTASASWKVTVISDFSFDLGPTVNVCDASSYIINPGNLGDTYVWSTGATTPSISVNSSGTYSLTVTTTNSCCYADDIEINFASTPDVLATGATLACGAASVQISGISATPGVTFSWTGPGGFTSFQQNPMVSSPGDYELTVISPEGCTASDIATVTSDTDVPDATAAGGTINCTTTSVQLMGSSTTAGVTYSWSGPESFSSSMQNPTVSVAGIYTLTVTGSNGCEVTADAEVISDMEPPILDLSDGVINCVNESLTYMVEGSASWTGVGGFSSSESSVNLMDPGTYNVTVTAPNMCTASASFEITEDISVPNIIAEGGVVNCSSGQDTLSGGSSTAGVTYTWSGPGGFTTNIQNPIAATLGTYTLIVTAPNGCTASQDVELIASVDAPQISATGGTIDCINTTVDLMATSDDTGLTYTWTGPGSFTASGATVQATLPGIYTVSAENEDGCVGNASVEVTDNAEIPDVAINAPNLNCLEGATKFTTTVSETVVSYSWSGPNDFTSTEKEPEVNTEGTYTLVVTSSNGCTNEASQTLISDVENPDASATGGTLTCTQNTVMIVGSTTTPSATFKWTGPANFSSTEISPNVSIPGTYYFEVSAPNGCTAIDSAEVLGDPDLPVVEATGGTINCTTTEVMLVGSTSSVGATIRWEGPNGFSSTNPTPIVDIPGTYTFTVTSTGDCVAFSSVEVVLDRRDPDLTVAQGFIDCEAGIRDFNIATNALDGTFEWTGPGGFTSNDINPSYNLAGTYNVTVTGTNGCSSIGSIVVEFDVDYDLNLVIAGNDVTAEIERGTPPFEVVFDDNIDGPSVTDLQDGDHFVKITDGLGCEQTIEFNINTTSVTDLELENKIIISPNPSTEWIKIDWSETEINADKLTIMNAKGQLYLQRNIKGLFTEVVDVSSLPAGIYYLRIAGEENLAFKKFLKM